MTLNPLWQANASTTHWAPPVSLSFGFPTDGDVVTGRRPTHVGGEWWEAMAEEIRNCIDAAGLTYDPADTTQFFQAVVILLGSTYHNALLSEAGDFLLTESGERIYL